MKKNVLVISASPRKGGNSDVLCDRLIQGAQESDNSVEKIFIRNKEIKYCIACEACQRNNGVCAIHDDMAEILDKMTKADVIVMASPVYYYSMNGQLKTLIDRTVARIKDLSGKEFYFILTAADNKIAEMRGTVEGFHGFTRCLDNAKEKGIIYGVGAWGKGEILDNPAMKQAYDMGRAI